MDAAELTTLTIAEAAARIRAKVLSPVELTEAYLGRIEALNAKLNAYVITTAERARQEAASAEREIGAGDYRGPLHGIPIGLKDLYDTAGIRTSGGCKAYEDRVPTEDSTVARKLREAGAILLGKLNTHELAYGTTTNNYWYGPTRNPWDTEMIPGGSSGGSGAATSGMLAAGTMGTDTGGSIRIPAALCGCVGLKPTYGRVSKAGVLMMSWQLDHPGPLTRTVRDAALMLSAVQGYDPLDACTARVANVDYDSAFSTGLEGLVVGVPRAYFFDLLEGEVRFSVEAALDVFRKAGATVKDVDLVSFREPFGPIFDMVRAEAAQFHAERLTADPEGFSPELHAILEQPPITAGQYVAAQRLMMGYTEAVRAALEGVSILVVPTTLAAASPIGAKTVNVAGTDLPPAAAYASLTAPFNVSGVPALSLPCGFTSAGLPIGMQVVGRPFDEWSVFRAAHGYEQLTDWHRRRPTL